MLKPSSMTPVNKKNKIKHRNTGTKNVLKDAKMTNNNNSQTPATRKFDGISVKLENNKIRYLYSGGLNAQNCIKDIPIHQQIESNNGDNSIVVEDDDALL